MVDLSLHRRDPPSQPLTLGRGTPGPLEGPMGFSLGTLRVRAFFSISGSWDRWPWAGRPVSSYGLAFALVVGTALFSGKRPACLPCLSR